MNHRYAVATSNHDTAGSKHISNHGNENLTKNLVSCPQTYIYIKNAIPFCHRAHQWALAIILLLREQCIYFMLCQPVCSRIIVYIV